MKRKIGLGFAPLKLISRSNKPKPVEEDALDLDDDMDLPLDSSFINRPPPLDPKTERELWKSCAVILQNLKPSGWDIEDTRMRSDMLVEDDEDYDANDQAVRAATLAQRRALQTQDRGKRSNPLVLQAVTHDREEKARVTDAVAPLSGNAVQHESSRAHDQPSSETLPRQDYLDYLPRLAQLEALESPLAPFHTEMPASSQYPTSPREIPNEPHRPTTAQRVDSSSTLASSRYSRSNSTNDINTSSTGFTSAAYTPDISSKRMSEQALADSNGEGRTGAGAGQWMKEEVDRRRQAETPSTKPSIPVQPTTFFVQDPPDSQLGQSTSRSATPDVRYRDSQSSFSRPRSTGPPRERKRVDESPGPTASTSSTDTSKAIVAEPVDFSNPAVSKSPHVKGDPQLDRPQTPQRTRDPVPPVPALPNSRGLSENERPPQPRQQEVPNITKTKLADSAETDNQLTQVTQTSISRQVELPQSASSRLSPISPKFPLNSLRPLSNASSDSRVSQKSRHTSRDSTTQKYQLIPLKHQEDESILVKDFWKPAGTIRRSGTTKSRHGAVTDVNAADFDDLMSFMKDTEEPVAATGRDSQSSRNASMVNSYADSVIDKQQSLQQQQQQQQTPAKQHQVVVHPTPAVAPLAPPPTNQLFSDRARSLTSLNNYRGGAAYSTSPAFGSHYSIQNGTASPASLSASLHSKRSGLGTEPRGFKKMFEKLSGDGSRKRNVYIPPPGPRYSEAEEDEWYDDQACAAPVVGFGRGW